MGNKANPTYTKKLFIVGGDKSKTFTAYRESTVRALIAVDKIKEAKLALAKEVKAQTENLRIEFTAKIKKIRKEIEITELSASEVLGLPADREDISLIAQEEAEAPSEVPSEEEQAPDEALASEAPAADEDGF